MGSIGDDLLPLAVLNELKALGTATLYEAQGQKGAMDHGIKPLDPSMKIAGTAFTVAAHPGDNLIIHYALTKAVKGDILVIDAQGFLEAGLWGDVLSEAAIQAGLEAMVVDGAVRDCETICELNFPVFARALSIKGTSKVKSGNIGLDILCGGASVRHGDIVVGDRDGIVVIARGDIEWVLEAAEKRQISENKIREDLKSGRTTIDILDLGPALKSLNLE